MTDDAKIEARLVEVLHSIFCPVTGCWFLHGCSYDHFVDADSQSHVLEVWPKGVPETEEHEGNGHHGTEGGLLYELAEFDFTELLKIGSFEDFHFSQLRSVFEIAWLEEGRRLELRVHIVPAED